MRKARGSVLVEAALVTPLWILITMGALEGGRLLFDYNLLLSAVSEGARLAATTPSLILDDPTVSNRIQERLRAGGLRARSVTIAFVEPLQNSRPISVRATVDFQPLIAAAWPSGGPRLPLETEITTRYEL